jgi:hypothetical protein
MSLGELFPMLVSFLLTLMVFSYILRDNPLFRVAVHLLIGVAAGYAGAVVWNGVILPQMIGPFYRAFSGGGLDTLFLALPPLVLGLLLLGKLSDRLAWIGSPTMAFLVGVGAATAIGGAVLGTMFPQIDASTNVLNLEGAFILLGTVLTLVYFQFSVRAAPDQTPRRSQVFEMVGWGGQVFIAVTFGVIFAGVYSAALTALIERWAFIIDFLTIFFS